MNIILKSFDGPFCRTIMEHTLKGLKLDTCIWIMNHKREMPDVEANKHIFLPAQPMREGKYPNVDWSTVAPLDEALVEDMRETQATFFSMLDRYALTKELWYEDRMRQYLAHLRYWNHMLDELNVDLYLANHIPHQCFDYVLYNLCKKKGIPAWYVERCDIVDAFYVTENIESSAAEIGPMLKRIEQEYGNNETEIPLSEKYEHYVADQTERNVYPWFTGKRDSHLSQQSFLHKWLKIAVRLLVHKPKQFLRSVTSAEFWRRKLRQHRTTRLYDELSAEPDLSKSFIYAPLHMQPEQTTCPMAGAFVNQELIVQLLAACLPEDVRIYVKEHPAQGETCRSEEFYRALASIPSVTLVPRSSDTFALTENAVAIATATGTAGFEGLFRGKPVLLFGHRFYQYAPGVYPIRSKEDCTHAVEEIFTKNIRPTLKQMRMFMRAVQETGTPYPDGSRTPEDTVPDEEKAATMGKTIGERIRNHMPSAS